MVLLCFSGAGGIDVVKKLTVGSDSNRDFEIKNRIF